MSQVMSRVFEMGYYYDIIFRHVYHREEPIVLCTVWS